MAVSDHRQMDTVEFAAGELWVSLQDGGDGVNELFLKEKDGDARGEKESIPNAVEGQESGQVTGKFLRWCCSALDDVHKGDAFWDNFRKYVLCGPNFVNTAFHILRVAAMFCGHVQMNTSDVLWACSELFTMAIVCPAALSFVTRFLSRLATKASFAKKQEVNVLLFYLLVTNVAILLASCFACIYMVRAGIMLLQQAYRQEYFPWGLKWLVEMTRMQGLVAAGVLAPSLVVLMGSDVGATFRAFRLHWRGTTEAQKAFTGGACVV